MERDTERFEMNKREFLAGVRGGWKELEYIRGNYRHGNAACAIGACAAFYGVGVEAVEQALDDLGLSTEHIVGISDAAGSKEKAIQDIETYVKSR